MAKVQLLVASKKLYRFACVPFNNHDLQKTIEQLEGMEIRKKYCLILMSKKESVLLHLFMLSMYHFPWNLWKSFNIGIIFKNNLNSTTDTDWDLKTTTKPSIQEACWKGKIMNWCQTDIISFIYFTKFIPLIYFLKNQISLE